MIHHDEASLADLWAFQERQEMFRRCWARVVADHEAGRMVDPLTLHQARQFLARTKPLGRPLSDGTNPARTRVHTTEDTTR